MVTAANQLMFQLPDKTGNHWLINMINKPAPLEITCQLLCNAAGLLVFIVCSTCALTLPLPQQIPTSPL